MTTGPLSLMEELMLLSLDRERGSQLVGQWIDSGLAGAALLQLTAWRRLSLTKKLAVVIDNTATGDGIADSVLNVVRESRRQRTAKHWIRVLPKKLRTIRASVTERLVDRGVLGETHTWWIGVFRRLRWPEKNPSPGLQLRRRIRAHVNGSSAGDLPTVGIVALMAACVH